MNKKEIEKFNSTIKKFNFKYDNSFKQNKFSSINILNKKRKLNLDSLINNFKFNSEIKIKNIFIEKNLKPPLSSFISNETIENSPSSHRNLLINNLLNKRLIDLSPKSSKSKFDKMDTIENLKKKYGKKIFLEKYEKKYQQKEKPIKYYLKYNRKKFKPKIKKELKFMSIYSNYYLNHQSNILRKNPTYEIIEFGEKQLIYANKLKLEENDKNTMKHPVNLIIDNNININQNKSSDRINLQYLERYLKRKNMEKRIKLNLNELKIKNNEELKKMRKNKVISLNKSLTKNKEIIKTNRVKYNSFIDKISKIFNKQVEKINKNDL